MLRIDATVYLLNNCSLNTIISEKLMQEKKFYEFKGLQFRTVSN